jgi:hypothetical protein
MAMTAMIMKAIQKKGFMIMPPRKQVRAKVRVTRLASSKGKGYG